MLFFFGSTNNFSSRSHQHLQSFLYVLYVIKISSPDRYPVQVNANKLSKHNKTGEWGKLNPSPPREHLVHTKIGQSKADPFCTSRLCGNMPPTCRVFEAAVTDAHGGGTHRDEDPPSARRC